MCVLINFLSISSWRDDEPVGKEESERWAEHEELCDLEGEGVAGWLLLPEVVEQLVPLLPAPARRARPIQTDIYDYMKDVPNSLTFSFSGQLLLKHGLHLQHFWYFLIYTFLLNYSLPGAINVVFGVAVITSGAPNIRVAAKRIVGQNGANWERGQSLNKECQKSKTPLSITHPNQIERNCNFAHKGNRLLMY